MQGPYPRIAFLLASLHKGSARGLWTELIAAAQSQRCTLFVLPGGRLDAQPGFEHMRNSVYQYARAPNIDSALCWASTLSGYATESAVERFLLDTIDVPLVTFGLKIGNHPFIGIDAYSGMKALIKHFIRAHGRRRIAFLGGPRQHSSAEDRYRAYCDALKEARIAYDPALVCLDFPWTEGRGAALQLIDERGLRPGVDFDALCAASDLMAFDAGMLLRERGIDIPFDVPLGGFNDSEESRIFSPPLTTVRMPFSHQAMRALRMVSEMHSGLPLSDTTLKTRLVIRSSCGCVLKPARKMVGSRANQALPSDLTEAFEVAVSTRHDRSFISLLEKKLYAKLETGGDTEGLQGTLSGLRSKFLEGAGSPEEERRAESLIHKGMGVICLAEERKYEYRIWKEKQDEQKLSLFNQELLCTKDIPSIIGAAAAHLPELGIACAYLVTRDKEGTLTFRGGFRRGKGGSAAEMIRPGRYWETLTHGSFLPSRVMPDEPGVYFVLPLFFESTDLGHVVIQAVDIDPSLYEEIRSILSSALRGVMLFEQGDEARKRAEKAEKSRSDIVAVISRELQDSIETLNTMSALKEGSYEVPRLKELVRYLLDFSEAKAGTALTKAALFDPYALCLRWVETRSESQARGVKIACVEAPPTYPALYGDEEQLARALSILAQLVSERCRTAASELSVAVSAQGCELRLSLPTECSSRTSGIVFPREGKDIRLELARQLVLLHGGHIRCIEDECGTFVALCLPYPLMNGTLRNIPSNREVPLCIGPDRVLLASAFSFHRGEADEALQTLSYNAAFNQDLSGAQRLLLYLDPGIVDHESSAALSYILDQETFQRAECYIALHPSLKGTTQALRGAVDVADFLRSILLSDSPSAILVIGNTASAGQEVEHIRHFARETGIRLVACSSAEAAEAALNRWRPLLFLVLETRAVAQGYDSLLRRFPAVPLIVASSSFETKEGWESILERPHTAFCNTGEVFSDLLLLLVKRFLEGEKALPSPTASIVARCIFFMNRTYADQLSRWKLASLLNTSEDYLSRIFHRQMGVSLWEYLARLRMVHAIALLRSTGASLAEIADRTGFRDEAYFCRVFKKITGTTPGSFRNNSFAEVRKVQESD